MSDEIRLTMRFFTMIAVGSLALSYLASDQLYMWFGWRPSYLISWIVSLL